MKTNLNIDAMRDAVRDAVKDFALDVWEDLGRTRLAGVAVGLTLAFLVITAIALRPGGDTDVASGNPMIPVPEPAQDVSFTVKGDEPLRMSDIDLSAPRDPFLSAGGSSDETLLAAGTEIVDSVMSGSTGASTADTGGATSLMPLDDLASAPTPTTAEGDPDAEFDGGHEPADAPSTPATDYSYTADVQFGLVDDLKRYATVQRLGLIPSRRMPLVMYLGVEEDHETAVFMIDSRLSQGGEGNCVPRDSLCTFLELKATPSQDEHHFRDADGNEYLLRLRALTRATASSGGLTGRDVSELRSSPSLIDGQG